MLITVWQVLLVVLLLMLSITRNQETAALYAAMFLGFAVLHQLPLFLPQTPIIAGRIAEFAYVTNFWESGAAVLLARALINRPVLPWHLPMLLPPAVASVAFAMAPAFAFDWVAYGLIIPLSLIYGCLTCYTVGIGALREGRRDCRLLLAAGLGAMLMGFHDTAIINNLITDTIGLKSSIVMALFLPAFSIIFLHRLFAGLNSVDTLREEAVVGRQIAVEKERQRIRRDHARRAWRSSDVGGRLVPA